MTVSFAYLVVSSLSLSGEMLSVDGAERLLSKQIVEAVSFSHFEAAPPILAAEPIGSAGRNLRDEPDIPPPLELLPVDTVLDLKPIDAPAAPEAIDLTEEGFQRVSYEFLPFAVSESDVTAGALADEPVRPEFLRAPDFLLPPIVDRLTPPPIDEEESAPLLQTAMEPPLGFTGPSGIRPSETQTSSHFVPVSDRWRQGYPYWDRYGKGHPWVDDYPYMLGHWWDPYNQNVLKGDYPIIGEHTFLNVTVATLGVFEGRDIPTATTPFESTARPNEEQFFGRPGQFFYTEFYRFQFDLFHGDTAAFKPFDYLIRIAPVVNVNHLDVDEVAVVNPDVRQGDTRSRSWLVPEEWFVDMKVTDFSPHYDFLSFRAGSQPFVSDFKGFIFADVNRGVRLYGTRLANRNQFNLIWFDQTEKDTNSQLNTFEDRHQNTFIANFYREDTFVPGYTAQASFHFNNDGPSFKFDKNHFLARPDPVGIFTPHEVRAYYLGWAGDGHFGRYNVTHAFYWVLGRDSLNPLGGQRQDINAQMAAIELSYDRDWVRLRTSFFFASGDHDINDQEATGFDTIFDNPNFAGGEFSYWNRQAIPLQGVNLVQRFSLVPDLRSSKFQGQSNFVNPGLLLLNFGFDFEVTPKLRFIQNTNFLWFETTQTLRQFVFQNDVSQDIGIDVSLGMEYRPFLNNNMIIVAGFATLIPQGGFEDLYNSLGDDVETLLAGFVNVEMLY